MASCIKAIRQETLEQINRLLVGMAREKRIEDGKTIRVFSDETVPAPEKVVSIFEEHTDIIVKDRRETLYGHKVCLTSGKSTLVTDCTILDGNPADATLAQQRINRGARPLHVAIATVLQELCMEFARDLQSLGDRATRTGLKSALSTSLPGVLSP